MDERCFSISGSPTPLWIRFPEVYVRAIWLYEYLYKSSLESENLNWGLHLYQAQLQITVYSILSEISLLEIE